MPLDCFRGFQSWYDPHPSRGGPNWKQKPQEGSGGGRDYHRDSPYESGGCGGVHRHSQRVESFIDCVVPEVGQGHFEKVLQKLDEVQEKSLHQICQEEQRGCRFETYQRVRHCGQSHRHHPDEQAQPQVKEKPHH